MAYSYANGGGTLLTGSPDYTARILINNLGALGSGCSSNQYTQIGNNSFTNTTVLGSGTALSGPMVGSNALESGRNLFQTAATRSSTSHCSGHPPRRRPADAVPHRRVQRAELGHLQQQQRTINITSPTNQTVSNGIFQADGTVNPTQAKPNATNNFGAATSAMAPRTIQGQIRFVF